MNKRRIFLAVLSLVLLVGLALGIAIPAMAARGTGGTVDMNADWLQSSGLNLVKGQDYAYSFAVIGDTQNLNLYYDVDKGAEHMNTLYQWIVDNKDAYNIQYVMGVGDVTQSWNRDYGARLTNEWLNAAEALSLLDGKIGYSLVRGNHDFSDAKDGFNGVFGIGDKTANGIDNQYYENLLALSATKDAENRPMAGFRIDGKIEETYRKVIMGGQKYIIFTLDWHPMSRETDCVKDTKDLCVIGEYCVTHCGTSTTTCAANSSDCVKVSGCKHHNSYVNGTTFCNTEICADDCTKHDTFGWMDSLLRENSDYSAIITMHSFIMRDGSTVDDVEDVFPYENVNNPSRPLWHEVAVTGGNASPKQLWDSVLSKHANVKMIFCGHVDEDNIITTQLKGVNGNTVTCQLIDGQTIDSKQEPVGLVAMYYMSADGKVVNVEYISTVRAAAGKPAYLRAVNQFTLTLDYSENGWVETQYGPIPADIYDAYTFHVMLDDDSDPSTVNTLYGSYNTWEETLTRVHELNSVASAASRQAKTYNIVMSKDYTYSNEVTTGTLDHNQSSKCLSKTVVDLYDYKNDKGTTLSVTSGNTLLPFYNATTSVTPNFTFKNGKIALNGTAGLAVVQNGHDNADGGHSYLNFNGVEIVYAEGATGKIIHTFDRTYGGLEPVYPHVTFTNCKIDASKAGKATLFNLYSANNDSDVILTLQGGSLLTSANAVVFTENYLSDKITFTPGENSAYTTLTLAGAVPAGVYYSETEGEFVEIINGAVTKTSQLLTKYGVIPEKWASASEYPFVLFKNGEAVHATKNWKTLIDTDVKGTVDFQSGCTLLLRKNYTTASADGCSGSPSYFAYIDDLTIDLNGYTLARGQYHLFQPYGTEVTQHTAKITVINSGTTGGLATTGAHALIVYNDNGNNTTKDTIDFVFDGISIDLSTTTENGLIVAYANGNQGLKSTVTLNDCTINLGSKIMKDAVFSLTESSGNKQDISVVINGGTLKADDITTLESNVIVNYSAERESGKGSPDKLILGKGSNGKYLTVKLGTAGNPSEKVYDFTEGKHYLVKNSDGTYSFNNINTPYGELGVAYKSITDYPVALFNITKGTSKGYADINSTLRDEIIANKTDEYVIYVRRDMTNNATAGFGEFRGKLTIDLGGNTLSISNDGNYLLDLTLASGATVSYVVKNGTLVKSGGRGFICFNYGTALNNDANVEMLFENVKFQIKNVEHNYNGVFVTWENGYDGATALVKVNSMFDNCVFDIAGSAADTVMLNLRHSSNSKDRVVHNVTLKGCDVLAGSLAYNKIIPRFYALDTQTAGRHDTITLAKGEDGAYITVYSTATKTPVINLGTNDGTEPEFAQADSYRGMIEYVLKSEKFMVEGYGNVSTSYEDTEKYPLLLFYNGEFVEGYSTFTLAIDKAKTLVDTASERNVCDTVYIVMRRDVYSLGESINLATLLGKVVVDLQNKYTLYNDSTATKGLINTFINYNQITSDNVEANLSNPGEITFKNGTIRNEGSYHMFGFDMTADSALGEAFSNYSAKSIIYNFDNVEFQAVKKEIMRNWNKVGEGINVKVNINNCTFNFTGMSTSIVMFNCTGTDIVYDIDITGNTHIIADNFNNYKIYNKATNDTVTFADDVNLTLAQTTSTVPTYSLTLGGVTYKFAHISTVSGVYNYKLGTDVVIDGFGTIPAYYSDVNTYPLVVLYNGNIIGYTDFNNAQSDMVKDSTAAQGTYEFFVRRDMQNNGKKNIQGFTGTIILNLNGKTVDVTSNGNYLFDFSVVNDTAPSATIYVKNGTLKKSGGHGLFCMNYNDNFKLENASFTYQFDNVTFVADGGSNKNVIFATWEAGYSKEGVVATVNVSSVFNNCTFDMTGNLSGAVMIPMNYIGQTMDRVVHNVTVNGGKIIADETSDINANFVTANDNTNGRADSFAFGKYEGAYTVLELDASATAPNAEFGGLKFVADATNGTTTTYILVPAATLNLEFAPMASVTLDSNLILNIYIPEHAGLKSATLNGTPVALTNAEGGYYIVSTALEAKEAAKTLTLVVVLDNGGTEIKGTFTFSTVKYVQKLLATAGVTEAEKTLAKDMLAYVKSAYNYFDSADKATVAEAINSVIGNYTAALKRVDGAAASDANDILAGTTFALDSTPAIRFYLHNGSDASQFSFKVGGRLVSAEDISTGVEAAAGDFNGYNYVDISLYAYRMIENVTITKGADTATYHINYYYDNMNTANAAQVEMITAFYNYCVSANAYRAEVTK